jgi:hypothetical protein
MENFQLDIATIQPSISANSEVKMMRIGLKLHYKKEDAKKKDIPPFLGDRVLGQPVET